MILDTCFLIDLQREAKRDESGPAHRFLESHSSDRFFIPAIAAAEFLEGFPDPRRGERLLAPFATIDFDSSTARIAAIIRRDLRLAGRLIGDFDILIAATALAADRPLVTDDTDHFARIPDLALMDYR